MIWKDLQIQNVKVGVLHSLTGSISQNEIPLKDAILMAIDEINEKGGILGCSIQPVILNGKSNDMSFTNQAKILIDQGINFIFGCWTSTSRKRVKEIVEKNNALLYYPTSHEGFEESKNIIYSGSSLNQLIMPTVDFSIKQGYKKYFLLASDSVFHRTTIKLMSTNIKANNGIVIQEIYIPVTYVDFSQIIDEIKECQPDVIIFSLMGDSNFNFFKYFYNAGMSSKDLPIISVGLGEREFIEMDIANYTDGLLSTCDYFQSINTESNRSFVNRYKARYGDDRLISSSIINAYSQVYIWKESIERAKSFCTDEVRNAMYSKTFNVPIGRITSYTNNYFSKNIYISKFEKETGFNVVWQAENIEPLPWLGIEKLNLPSSSMVKEIMEQYANALIPQMEVEKNVKHRNCVVKKTQEQIWQDQKLQALGDLVSGITHDFNNILGGIVGWGEQIKMEGDKNNRGINEIIKSALQASELSRKLLVFAGRDITEFKPIDIHSSIKDGVCLLEHTLDKKIQIESNFHARECIVNGEASLIQNIILNLGINARDAMQGGGTIKIETKNIYLDSYYCERSPFDLVVGEYIEISITDEGTGIDPIHLPFIFNPYFTTKQKDKGTGLGLSTVHTTILEHRGSIDVLTKVGIGTTFRILIPIIYDKVPVKTEVKTNEFEGSGYALVLEDDEQIRETSMKMLEYLGYHTLEARDGLEGVEIFLENKDKISLVLMDLIMPNFNGFDFLQQIDEYKGNTKIIVMSGFTGDDLFFERKSKYYDSFIEKPFSFETLNNSLLEIHQETKIHTRL